MITRLRYAAVSTILAAVGPTIVLTVAFVVVGAGFLCGAGFQLARGWS